MSCPACRYADPATPDAADFADVGEVLRSRIAGWIAVVLAVFGFGEAAIAVGQATGVLGTVLAADGTLFW